MVERTRRDAHRRMEVVLVIEAEVEHHVQHAILDFHLLLEESEVLELLPESVKLLLIVVTFQGQ